MVIRLVAVILTSVVSAIGATAGVPSARSALPNGFPAPCVSSLAIDGQCGYSARRPLFMKAKRVRSVVEPASNRPKLTVARYGNQRRRVVTFCAYQREAARVSLSIFRQRALGLSTGEPFGPRQPAADSPAGWRNSFRQRALGLSTGEPFGPRQPAAESSVLDGVAAGQRVSRDHFGGRRPR